MKNLIQKLTETFSPSGYESPSGRSSAAKWKPLADEVRVDALGNLIVRKGTKGKNGKRIMLAAHMDEIGLIATHIDENGFIRFTSIGGVRPHTMLSGRVHFANGTQGVIGDGKVLACRQIAHALRECYIDVGATSAKDCPVKVGDVAAFERPFLDLGERLVAKSMDDRIGCAVLIETLRALKTSPHELYFVFTTQEEVGTRGATTSAFGIDPDIGLSVDVTLTGDTPKDTPMAVSLGKGPAVKVKDYGHAGRPAHGGMDVFHCRKEAHPLPARGAGRRHHGCPRHPDDPLGCAGGLPLDPLPLRAHPFRDGGL